MVAPLTVAARTTRKVKGEISPVWMAVATLCVEKHTKQILYNAGINVNEDCKPKLSVWLSFQHNPPGKPCLLQPQCLGSCSLASIQIPLGHSCWFWVKKVLNPNRYRAFSPSLPRTSRTPRGEYVLKLVARLLEQ